MSNPDGRLVPGSTFGQYLLLEHLGADQLGVSWTAQQTALGSPVILEFLHPEIVANADRLALIESEAHAARALHHPAIGRVYGADSSGSEHFIVSEFVEGRSLAEELRDVAIDAGPLAHIAIAIVEALNYAHSSGVIHGNLHARHILVADDGRVKVLGFGAGRGCSAAGRMKFDGRDLETVGYLSPERVAGHQLDPRSDVFSFGVLLYEMATGTKPFHAETADRIAERILHSPPSAPHLINPAISPGIVGIIGRCVHKDPSRRYQSANDLLADLRKLASGLEADRGVVETTPARGIETLTGLPESEQEIETVANRDVARRPEELPRERAILYVTLPEAHDEGKPSAAALAGRMHEIVDETVYLADGKILDPFAEQVIAEFGNVFDAVRAARKCLHDLAEYNKRQTGRAPTLDARLVVIQGDLETVAGAVRGPAVEMARVASRAIDPMKLAVAADVMHETSAQPVGGPLVTVAGRTFFELTAAPVMAAGIAPPSRPEPVAPVVVPPPPGLSRHIWLIGAMLAVLLVAGIATGVVLMRRNAAAEAEAMRQAELEVNPAPVVIPGPKIIAFETLSAFPEIEPSAMTRANLVRFGAIGMLRSLRELDVISSSAGNAPRFTAEIRQGAAGLEIVPVRLTPAAKEGPAIPLDGSASVPLANWIASEMAVQRPFEPRNPTTLERFASAVAAMNEREEPPDAQTVSVIRGVLQLDPQFLAAQMLAIDVFERSGDRSSAIDAASKVVSLDPDHVAVRRRLARWLFQMGNAVGAASHFAEILARDGNDADAITAAGFYALAVRDEETFKKALARLESIPGADLLHAPDLMLASAQIDQAASPYFDLEANEPNNAALALKIGRIAVLRHMNSIADIELAKLERLDPSYGLPMLRAYVYAQQGRRAEAETELTKAQRVAPWHAQPYTNAAEVYAILGVPGKVIESLETAVARGEPTGNYVRSNPLFRYLKGEARFRKLSERIDGEQAEIRRALALLTL